MTKAKSILMMTLMFVGCSQEVPNIPVTPPSPTTIEPKQALATAPVVPVDRIPADAFTVVLSDVDCSDKPVAVATVKWDAGADAAGGVSIFVESPQTPRKLWAEASQKDEATTGKWVFEGTRFVLQDRVSGAGIAERTVDTIPCPRK